MAGPTNTFVRNYDRVQNKIRGETFNNNTNNFENENDNTRDKCS